MQYRAKRVYEWKAGGYTSERDDSERLTGGGREQDSTLKGEAVRLQSMDGGTRVFLVALNKQQFSCYAGIWYATVRQSIGRTHWWNLFSHDGCTNSRFWGEQPSIITNVLTKYLIEQMNNCSLCGCQTTFLVCSTYAWHLFNSFCDTIAKWVND